MVGRGSYGKPWFVNQVMHFLATGERLPDPSLYEQMTVMLEHYEDMLSHYGEDAGVRIARKHISWYSKGLNGSSEFRNRMNRMADPKEVREAIAAFYTPLLERQAA